jgi:hypothetical protein
MASARRGVPRPRRSDVRIDQGGPDWAAKGSWRPVPTWRRSTLGGASFTHTGSGRAPKRNHAKISTPRSGCHLRRARHPVPGQHGNSRTDHRSWSTWQNAFAERVIGSIRRECLDHVIILSEAHLCRVLRAYLAYYNTARPHQSLDNTTARRQQSPPTGRRTPAMWPDRRHASGRWAPSPLPARRLIAVGRSAIAR